MVTLRVPGTEEMLSGASGLAGQRRYGMKVTQKKAYRIERGRAAEKSAQVLDARADDVIEIELEGGLKLWTTVERFEKDFGRKVRGEEGVVTVPAELSLGGPSRGWGSWVLRGSGCSMSTWPGWRPARSLRSWRSVSRPASTAACRVTRLRWVSGKKPASRKATQSCSSSTALRRIPRAASVDSGKSQTNRFDGLFSSNTMTSLRLRAPHPLRKSLGECHRDSPNRLQRSKSAPRHPFAGRARGGTDLSWDGSL